MEEVFSKEVPALLCAHFQHLHEGSGISVEVIKERQYESTLGKKRLIDLGFNPSQRRTPGIIIPLWGVNGQIAGYQYRPDRPRSIRDKIIKYENQPGSSICLDIPPRCQPLLKNPKIPILFVEGVKKADALASQGACVVGLNGVWGFKGKNPLGGTTILADFDYIALKERESYIVYDSDYSTNPQVHQAQDRLAEHLKRKGAKVKVVYLPPKKDGGKQGADDFLVTGHTLADILALAVEKEIPPKIYGEYIIEAEGKPVKLNLERLVRDLMAEYYFATLVDTHEVLIYRDGFWRDKGEEFIERECQQRVQNCELLTKYKVNEIIGHIQRSTYCSRKMFNRDKWIINVENGLLDVRRKELKPHSPHYFCTIRIPVTYNPSADCPKIKQFFKEVLNPEDIPVIEELFGYCLIPDYSIQRAFLLVGDGANGKSTLLNLLKAFIGAENCAGVPWQALELNRFAKSELDGKLVNMFADIPTQSLSQTGGFKMLTGGDSIGTEKKFKGYFSFVNYARLIFSANKPPKVYNEDSYAFWRRWIILDFPNEFTGEKADKQILEKLTTREELSGLLNLALTGLSRLLKKQEFSYIKSVDDVTEIYLKAADPIFAFLKEKCEVANDQWISKDDLYETFKEYCKTNKIPLKKPNSFARALQNQTFINISSDRVLDGGKRVRVWKGIKWKEADE
jgi:putative DNA primase/helicase